MSGMAPALLCNALEALPPRRTGTAKLRSTNCTPFSGANTKRGEDGDRDGLREYICCYIVRNNVLHLRTLEIGLEMATGEVSPTLSV